MRRSASPSKAKGGLPPSRPLRRDDSVNVLKAAFKPPSGLENKPKPSKAPPASTSAVAGPSTPRQPSPVAPAAREVRVKSIPELESEIAAMEAVVAERLAAHNAERKSQGLAEQQPEQVVSEYISLLTRYNKVKDSAQLIFDKIAEKEQLPAGDIHARYGVAESDA